MLLNENTLLTRNRTSCRISKSTTTGKITTPVLEITYSERDTTLIALADISPLSRPVYTLSARYTMDYSGFWGRIGIVFALVCLTAVVTWGGRVYLWSKRNYAPSDPVDLDVRGQLFLPVVFNSNPIHSFSLNRSPLLQAPLHSTFTFSFTWSLPTGSCFTRRRM